MRGSVLGIELHIVSCALPKKARTGQQIVRLIRIGRPKPQRLQRNFHPARLHMMRVEIHHHDDNIAEIVSVFGVTNHLLVIDLTKTQAPIAF